MAVLLHRGAVCDEGTRGADPRDDGGADPRDGTGGEPREGHLVQRPVRRRRSLNRNRPVTRSPAAAGPDRVAAFSTEPGVTCSRLATATGSATGSGLPGRSGPGHVPAVSVVRALIPASAASWICQLTGAGVPEPGSARRGPPGAAKA